MTKRGYTTEPQVPPEMKERLQLIVQVLSGETTVTEAAQKLRVSRNHFQSLMHKALAGMIQGLTPGQPGRQPTPEKEQQLSEEKKKLEKENERLQERVDTIDRLMTVATGLIRGQIRTKKTHSEASSTDPGTGSEPEDPDGAKRRLEGATKLRKMGLAAPLAAAIVGASTATVRRWAARERCGRELRGRRGPAAGRPISEESARKLEEVLREMHGLCGADALRHEVPGVSRRQAAAVKQRTLTTMERERKAQANRITVHMPGVLRGFDQLQLTTRRGSHFLLIAADGSVPYRTSAWSTRTYDTRAVAAALKADFERNGAPLVLRMDRASSHRADPVQELCTAHQVLVLHGPPHCPQFYGQLERQNREHRGWLAQLGNPDPEDFDHLAPEMLAALNGRWRRATLGWRTAEQVWSERPALTEDRAAMREEVEERVCRIRESNRHEAVSTDLAWRLAIEQALLHRGYLSRQRGGWC